MKVAYPCRFEHRFSNMAYPSRTYDNVYYLLEFVFNVIVDFMKVSANIYVQFWK